MGKEEPDAASRKLKVLKRMVTKMSGSYQEETLEKGQTSPLTGEFRVGSWVCKPYPVTGRD